MMAIGGVIWRCPPDSQLAGCSRGHAGHGRIFALIMRGAVPLVYASRDRCRTSCSAGAERLSRDSPFYRGVWQRGLAGNLDLSIRPFPDRLMAA